MWIVGGCGLEGDMTCSGQLCNAEHAYATRSRRDKKHLIRGHQSSLLLVCEVSTVIAGLFGSEGSLLVAFGRNV